MTPRHRIRLGLAATSAAVLAVVAAPHATADDTPDDAPDTETVTAEEWACLAIGEIDLGICVDDPVPDLGGLPTVPDLVAELLGSLGL